MKMQKKSTSFFPAMIFAVALVLRVIPVILMRGMGIGLDDMYQYDMLARSIVSGEGFRWYAEPDLKLVQDYLPVQFSMEGYDPRGVLTSFRPPLYPSFLALVYLFSGVDSDRFFIARLVQCFLNAALAPLVFLLSRRLYPARPLTAKIAAWVITLYPMMILYPLALATENLFFLLAVSSLVVLCKACDSRKAGWFILAGLLLGMTALTRSVALGFAGLACLWVWFSLREWRKAVLLFAMVAVVTAPWMIRNTLLHGRLTGIESGLGYDLYLGYHPQGSGTFQYGISLDLIPILDDGRRDELGQQLAWEFIKEDPGRVPYLMVRRLGHFFGLERRALTYFYTNDFFGYIEQPILMAISSILLLPFMIVSTSAAFGLAMTPWNKKTPLLSLFMAGYLLPHMFILGEDRFHLALVPLLAALSAHAWLSRSPAVIAQWSQPRGRLALLLAGMAILLLLFNWGAELYRDREILSRMFEAGGNLLHLPY